MSVRKHRGVRLSAAVVAAAVPLSLGGFSTTMTASAREHAATERAGDTAALAADVSLAPISPSVTSMQRAYLLQVSDSLRPQRVAPQTTLVARLSLATAKDRNRRIAVSSTKGGAVWTASSLAEHDLPSAALRAYKHAAASMRSSDPGCALPWQLLAGIGRVESDHGRYGGSVLGDDGVPRPAIVGIALDGKGPVAAIHDTDGGRFDGDEVWDRAVGPMQFIPSTWRSAGRDGDGDGLESPNDIDDASLAAASYLCGGGGDLSTVPGQRSAILRYNASDYYVALVTAFETGYRTGVFTIPSPEVAPGAGDGVVHRAAKHAAKKAKHHKVAKPAKPARKHRPSRPSGPSIAQPSKPQPTTAPKPTKPSTPKPTKPSTPKPPKPSPTPTPSPTPQPPKPVEQRGVVTAVAGGWQVGGSLRLTPGDLGPIGRQDYDGDGTTEDVAAELDGLAAAGGSVVVAYLAKPTFTITGFSAL